MARAHESARARPALAVVLFLALGGPCTGPESVLYVVGSEERIEAGVARDRSGSGSPVRVRPSTGVLRFQLNRNDIVWVLSIGTHAWVSTLSVNGPFGNSVQNGIAKWPNR